MQDRRQKRRATFSMSTQLHSGSNSTAVRHFNERRLLTVLRRLGEASKADLARHLNLTQNTVGQIVQVLEQQGLVASGGRRMGQRGQPATLLRLDPDGAYSLGVKLGRRSIDTLLVDFTGGVLKSRRIECLFPRPDEALKLALRSIHELRRALPRNRRGRLIGVGLALPSNLDGFRHELNVPAETCQAWQDYDVAEPLRQALEMPLLVENDCTAAAVAELFHGHGRELDDFACVYISSSIGGGIVLDGDYRHGVHGHAGDIGLIPVPPSRLSHAAGRGTHATFLLDRASGGALIRHLRINGIDIVRAIDLHAVMRSHGAVVAEWLDDCAEALVMPLLSTASLLDVQAIILDGNLPKALIEALLERLRPLLQHASLPARAPPELRLGSSGNHAAALGAALLPLHSRHGQASIAATTSSGPALHQG
jgi:predicted NBD/HSP70 family sugar kinase